MDRDAAVGVVLAWGFDLRLLFYFCDLCYKQGVSGWGTTAWMWNSGLELVLPLALPCVQRSTAQ